MSFGWSVGDIIAGINAVWVAWQAVSDGPLNAQYQAQQFFTHLGQIAKRLDHWEKQGLADEQDASSRQELKKQCQEFIERHMDLIQEVVPKAKTDRRIKCYDSVGGTYQTITRDWLKKAEVTRQQAKLLYQKVTWPYEEKAISRLGDQLRIFLHLATYDIAAATHEAVQELLHRVSLALYRPSNEELQISKDSKELVSIVKTILLRVTNPLERDEEIDYPILQQLAQLLPPPQPMRQIEGASSRANIPWQASHDTDEVQYSMTPHSSASGQKTGLVQQNEIRSTVKRLDNLSMRRVETIDTISASSLIARENVHMSIERLQSMRGHIGKAVGIAAVGIDATLSNGTALEITEPENALQKEITEWTHLYERIEQEILHPGPHSTHPARPIDIPRRSSPGSPDPVSPGSSPGFWDAQIGTHHRRSTTASTTAPHFIELTRALKATITYRGKTKNHTVKASIHSIVRFDNGDVQAILSSKEDGSIHFHHSVDMKEKSNIETSMKPFLDNSHVIKGVKWRVQFKGCHFFKVTKETDPTNPSDYQCLPIYQFSGEKDTPPDFLEFQYLLLNKEVKSTFDVTGITSTQSHVQCKSGTISILLDPTMNTRHIIYFRQICNDKPIKPGKFIEWPVSFFKYPEEPRKSKKSLTIESLDDDFLPLPRGITLRDTQSSIRTIQSNESANEAFSRMEKTSGIKGLVIEFYNQPDCHKFWKEFRA